MLAADMVPGRFRRLRDFPPSKTMRPHSATRARLVLTPLCCSNRIVASVANATVFHCVTNFVASDVASRDYRLVANTVPTDLPIKNSLLGWRYWPVGAASEPSRLRVAGERHWPGLFASAL